MYTLKVENNKGEALNLSSNPNYQVYKITGLNPPAANISLTDNSTMDGGAINNVRVGSRNLVLYMTIEGDVETNRINLYKYFPPKKTVTIYFTNDTRNVYIQGTVELIECDQFSKKQVAQISIICPKPYFKGVDTLVTSFSNINSLFEFPFSIPAVGIEFSSLTANSRKTIINTGDTETGVIIELFATGGSVVNPVIYDALNRTFIKLNFTLLQSDLITINTNQGEKSITLTRNGVTSNAMGYMSQDSNWLQLAAGDNVFTYGVDSGGTNLQATFYSEILYGGV